jgi:hypothetical protein
MHLFFEIYLVEGGDSVLVAKVFLKDRIPETIKEIVDYLERWGSLYPGKELRIRLVKEG